MKRYIKSSTDRFCIIKTSDWYDPEGLNIPDEYWKNLQDQFNDKLKEMGRDQLDIDFKTGESKKKEKKEELDYSIADLTKDNYETLVEVSDNFKSQFFNAGVMLNGKVYSSKVEKDCEEIYPLKNIIQKDKVDDKFFLNKETGLILRLRHTKEDKFIFTFEARKTIQERLDYYKKLKEL